MTRLPPRPDLDWKDDGTPVAQAFDDVYFSLSDGLEETRSVFLKACGLPERWKNQKHFTVAELGFGTGLNMVALIFSWLQSKKQPDAWLHFVSCEKYLMEAADSNKVLVRWPELKFISDRLIETWPDRASGLQRIIFPDWNVTFSLYVGDVQDWLETCDFTANAWFLDGFAPARNDDMWGAQIYQRMARKSAEGCLIGTYTVAGAVRRGLAEAGFQVSKREGFGRKRERLEAIWSDPVPAAQVTDPYLTRPCPANPSKVVIIGAGIAGACVARRFAEAGSEVLVLDEGKGPASGASGNPFGLVMPRLDAADTPQARFLIQSYLFARRYYARACPTETHDVTVQQIAQNDKEAERFEKLLADPPLDEGLLADGGTDEEVALLHKGALLCEPHGIVQSLLDHPAITCRFEETIGSLEALKDRSDENTIFVITSGWRSKAVFRALSLPLTGKAGQVDWAEGLDQTAIAEARASGTYALKIRDNILFGATFESISDDEEPGISTEARTENLEALERLAPDWKKHLEVTMLKSRASVRGTTPDRMPVAGVVFDDEKFRTAISPLAYGRPVAAELPYDHRAYILAGLGARGFTFAPLLAELVWAQATGAPLPLARPELEQISPARFSVRAVRRGG